MKARLVDVQPRVDGDHGGCARVEQPSDCGIRVLFTRFFGVLWLIVDQYRADKRYVGLTRKEGDVGARGAVAFAL